MIVVLAPPPTMVHKKINKTKSQINPFMHPFFINRVLVLLRVRGVMEPIPASSYERQESQINAKVKYNC